MVDKNNPWVQFANVAMDDKAKGASQKASKEYVDLQQSISKKLKQAKPKIEMGIKKSIPTSDKIKNAVKADLSLSELLGENESTSKFFRFRYRGLKHKILGVVKKAVPAENKIKDAMKEDLSLSSLIGENESSSKFFRFRYRGLKHKILTQVAKAIPTNDRLREAMKGDLSVGSLIGENKTSSKFFRFRYRGLKHGLLTKINKSLPNKFDDLKTNLTIDELLGDDTQGKSSKLLRFRLFLLRNKLITKLAKSIEGKDIMSLDAGASGSGGNYSKLIYECLTDDIKPGIDRIVNNTKPQKIDELQRNNLSKRNLHLSFGNKSKKLL